MVFDKDSNSWISSEVVKNSHPRESIPVVEQETVISWSKRDKEAQVYSCDSSIILKLSRNPHFSVKNVLLNASQKIIQVEGTLPTNFITIRKKSRSNPHFRCNSTKSASEEVGGTVDLD